MALIDDYSQLTIHLDAFAHFHFHSSDPLARLDAFLFCFIGTAVCPVILKFIAPRTSIAISIPVIIAQEVVAPCILASFDFKRLIDRGEKVLSQLRSDPANLFQ